MITPSETSKIEAITWPTDVACLSFFVEGGGPRVFPLFALNHWYRFEVVNPRFNLVTNLKMEILMESLEVIQKCPGNVNSFQLGLWRRHSFHLTDSLLIPNISIKTVWSEPEIKPVDLAIWWTITHLSFRIIQWTVSTCSSVVDGF